MIVGDPDTFAIESGITKAFERLSFRALGFFVIHVGGRRYGVHEPDATMLALALDDADRRLAFRGKHNAPFASVPDASKIAHAFRNACYAEEQEDSFFDIDVQEFRGLIHSNHLDDWSPNAIDEAFDDGSYILQFDVGDRVRLVAYKSKGWSYDPETLKDIWVPADDFYSILHRWRKAFETEWAMLPKIGLSEDGAECG